MGKKTLIFLFVLLLLPIAFAKSGSMRLLAVANTDLGQRGSVADIYLEIKPGTGRVFIDSFPLSQVDTQISTRFAKEVACNFIEADCTKHDFFYTIRSTSGLVGGPSAGAATAVLTVAVLEGLPIDQEATITGTINTGGLIGPVGGVSLKLDAASKNKITKVLVPKHTLSNETNISENLEVVEVSHLAEAVKEITGKDYANTGNLELDKTYIEVMKKLSVDICERATGLMFILDAKNEKYELGQKAINDTKYYSAASYCFIASLELRNEFLLQKNLSENEINKEINKIFLEATALKEEIDKTEINTITDLETYMVVSSRIAEAREKLDDSLKSLNESKADASIFNLAYGIERLNTAKSWAGFFSTFGKEFKLDKGAIEESCLKKISEVEERAQYVELYLPGTTESVRNSAKDARKQYELGNPELCLYEASIAKARTDVVLNTIYLDPDSVNEVIEDRLNIVYSLIAKQTNKGIFPIVAYSYYEYADSLKKEDQASALLYLEYALELGNLDIYFEEKKFSLPYIDKTYLIIFLAGLVAGLGLAIFVLKRKFKR